MEIPTVLAMDVLSVVKMNLLGEQCGDGVSCVKWLVAGTQSYHALRSFDVLIRIVYLVYLCVCHDSWRYGHHTNESMTDLNPS